MFLFKFSVFSLNVLYIRELTSVNGFKKRSSLKCISSKGLPITMILYMYCINTVIQFLSILLGGTLNYCDGLQWAYWTCYTLLIFLYVLLFPCSMQHTPKELRNKPIALCVKFCVEWEEHRETGRKSSRNMCTSLSVVRFIVHVNHRSFY